MQTYFVVATLLRFEGLRRQIGYARALRELDGLCDELADILPAEAAPRANRASIEFLIEAESPDDATAQLAALQHRIRGVIPLRRQSFDRQLAVGAVRCPTRILTEELVAQAEGALRSAHELNPPLSVVELSEVEHQTHHLMDDLRKAIRSDGLHLVYQPKLCARGRGVLGAEALIRWKHPIKGVIPPTDFIAAAERNGVIRSLTDWVIDRVLRDSLVVEQAGLDCPLHINISAPLVGEPDFIEQALARLGSSTKRIGFEITETAMMVDPEGALANLRRLAAAGVALSVDDYGAGFSSLAYLQQLPVHEIKIDRMFVSRLTSGSRDPLLVRSTIDLAHALEMKVTAEGVDSAAALALLQVMGCDMLQGFLLSPPLPVGELITYAERAVESALPTIAQDRWSKLARAGRR